MTEQDLLTNARELPSLASTAIDAGQIAVAKGLTVLAAPGSRPSAGSRPAISEPESPSYVLIPSAGGMAWYGHRVVRLLEQAQREAIAVDCPEITKAQVSTTMLRSRFGKSDNNKRHSRNRLELHRRCCLRTGICRQAHFRQCNDPLPGETAGEWWENAGGTDCGCRERRLRT